VTTPESGVDRRDATDDAIDDAPGASSGASSRRVAWWIGGGAAAAAVAIALGALIGTLTTPEPVSPWARTEQVGRSEAADFEFVIPKGALDRMQAGEDLQIVPANLTVKVGQVVRVRNEDLRPVVLGPFAVGPLQTLTQRFATPGTLEGDCNVHASGRIVITVER
jgi:hypothetical protein